MFFSPTCFESVGDAQSVERSHGSVMQRNWSQSRTTKFNESDGLISASRRPKKDPDVAIRGRSKQRCGHSVITSHFRISIFISATNFLSCWREPSGNSHVVEVSTGHANEIYSQTQTHTYTHRYHQRCPGFRLPPSGGPLHNRQHELVTTGQLHSLRLERCVCVWRVCSVDL